MVFTPEAHPRSLASSVITSHYRISRLISGVSIRKAYSRSPQLGSANHHAAYASGLERIRGIVDIKVDSDCLSFSQDQPGNQHGGYLSKG